MSDGPSEFWPYRCHGPLAGRVLTHVEQIYRVEISCIARPVGALGHRDVHIIGGNTFDWQYEFTVNYNPWDRTPLGGGDALTWDSDDVRFEPRGPGGPRPRLGGPLAVDAIERQLDLTGIAPRSDP